ncbi:TolB protein [Silvibacterium bohemicum]|uniref:TolB protein n=1 Tax=Silvibacterium bohemicum TaxID=1577686 RepID=A0A841JPY0_9BACT|nr:Tol-Pal system beta propeller repeat protein TolB [Silvibacterium bohemicum]MBB6143442.1 TolB protein [Silvibacterium bohemicum]
MNGKYAKLKFLLNTFLVLSLLLILSKSASAQDWVRTGTNLGVQRIRLAAADFKAASADPQTAPLKTVFDSVLFSDLKNSGVFDMVAKSMAPGQTPGGPQEMNLSAWSGAPSNAEMVAFGSFAVNGGQITVQGFVFDTKNPQSPQILGKQYSDTASEENARHIAHRFADEIIMQLGGGLNGICETKIFYVSGGPGGKEIWSMDYDGADAKPVTHLGTISISPRVSPDNSRVAFSSLGKNGWSIRMYSLVLGRMVSFSSPGGTTLSPAWSSDGSKLALSSSPAGDSEIYTADASGGSLHRITAFRGPDVSPVWNPKSNAQIAWVSGRTGLPQIYVMDSDGANVQRMTDGGYATSPSWSPNGQFLAFAWNRKYGPGAPGGQDIYIMDIASKRWIQLTHESGANDFPSWSPDGRHIVFQREGEGGTQIWSMLADGTEQQRLTTRGANSMPNWSWK